ncbi:hypothetical protein V7O66_03355 [Methanolobus sp. ZRKC3]|uniref:hypothetical protein n=1 Tax=Methanolobus sp. ZRKC3 TaxID=3125786 RepID=UPI0032448892
MRNYFHLKWITIAFVLVLVISTVAFSMWDKSKSDGETEAIEQVNNTSSSQDNVEEEIEITKYTFTNYGGEIYTPEPMEFGSNIENDSVILGNATERKHILLQFYATPNESQRQILQDSGVRYIRGGGAFTMIVSMPANLTPADISNKSGLRWMGEIPVENKYDPSFGLNVPAWAKTDNDQVKLWLAFYEDVTYEEAQTISNKYSSSTPIFEMYPYSYNSIIVTNESNLTVIATEDAIERIVFGGDEPVPE